MPEGPPRRNFLKTIALVSAGAALGFDGIHEFSELKIEAREIHLRRLPPAFDGFRIAQISDIHFGEFMSSDHLQRIVAAINAQRPDLVAVTGDYVTAPIRGKGPLPVREAWTCAEILRGIKARFAPFAVVGNHDCNADADMVSDALAANGLQVLRNRAVPIEAGGKRFWLAGLDDWMDGEPDPDSTFREIPSDECIVLAVHEPDCADKMRKYGVDLQISGHSHGGQIRFPLIGPLYLPPGGTKYYLGYYKVGSLQLYTNRGVGVMHLPVRFMCPPELTVLTLRSA